MLDTCDYMDDGCAPAQHFLDFMCLDEVAVNTLTIFAQVKWDGMSVSRPSLIIRVAVAEHSYWSVVVTECAAHPCRPQHDSAGCIPS